MADRNQFTQEEIRQELIRRGVIDRTSIVDAGLRAAGDTLSLGLGDELQGQLAAPFWEQGEGAERRRNEATEASRRRLEEARSDRPFTTTGIGVAGALVPGTLALRGARVALGAGRLTRELNAARTAGNVEDVARLAPQAARAGRQALYGSSAAQGAVYGAGSGETGGERALGAGVGGAAGFLGAGVGEGVGSVVASLRGLRDPVVRAERMLSRELSESVPSEQDLTRRLVRSRYNPTGLTPAAARSEARRIIQAGDSGRFTTDDMVSRARYAEGRAIKPTMMEMVPRWTRTARAINATGGPGEGVIGQTLDAQRAQFGRDIARQARQTLKPRGSGPGAGGRSRLQGAAVSIDRQPPPTGLQDLSEQMAVARRAQNRLAYNAAYGTQLTAQQQTAAARRMTGGAFKQRARRAAIDRAEEDIARLSDDLDNLRESGGSNDAIGRAEAELADAMRAQQALQSLDGSNPDPSMLNARAIDLYQRGLRHLADEAGGGATEGGRNVAAVRSTFMENLRTISPELHSAASGARGFQALEEARTLGQGIFRPGKEAEIDQLLRRSMSTDEQDSFVVGVLDAFEAKLATNELSAVRALQRNQNWRQLVARSARSTRAGNRLLALIDDKVAELDRGNFVRGGSPTAPIQEDIRRLTQEGDLTFFQDVIEAGGDIRNPILRRVASTADRLIRPGIRNPRVQTEMARMMTQPGTRANAEALAARLQNVPKASIFTPEGQRFVDGAGVVGSVAAQQGAGVTGSAVRQGMQEPAYAGGQKRDDKTYGSQRPGAPMRNPVYPEARFFPRAAVDGLRDIPLYEILDAPMAESFALQDAQSEQASRELNRRVVPFGLGAITEPFVNTILEPERRESVARNSGEAVDWLGDRGGDVVNYFRSGRAGRDASSAVDAAPDALANLPHALSGAWSEAARQTPGVLQQAGAAIGQGYDWVSDQANPELFDEPSFIGGVGSLAVEYGPDAARMLTYGPWENERRMQGDIDLQDARRRRGLAVDEGALDSTADEANLETLFAGANIASAPFVGSVARLGASGANAARGLRSAVTARSARPPRAADAAGRGEFRTMMGVDPTRPLRTSRNAAPSRIGDEAGALQDFLNSLPTTLERLTPEQYARAAALHPWFRQATTGAPNPSRIDLVRLSNARAPDGRARYGEDAIANLTGGETQSHSVLRALARQQGVPVLERRRGGGIAGATGAPGGERLASIIRIMERAERNNEYVSPKQIAVLMGVQPGSKTVYAAMRRARSGSDPIPPEVLARFRALDASQRARRASGRIRRVDDTLGWLATGGALTAAGLAGAGDAEAADETGVQSRLQREQAALDAVTEERRRWNEMTFDQRQDFLREQHGVNTGGRGPGPLTDGAFSAYVAGLDKQEEEIRGRISAARSEMAQEAGQANPALDLGVKALNAAAIFGGMHLGMRGRSRDAARASAAINARNAAVNESIPMGSVNMGTSNPAAADRLQRAGAFNQMFVDAGQGRRAPFNTAAGQANGYSASPGAGQVADLYRPGLSSNRFLRGEDVRALGYGGAESYSFHALAEQERTHLEELEARRVGEQENPVLAREIANTRLRIEAYDAASRAGLGYAGGRAFGAFSTPYSVARPSRMGDAEGQVAQLNRFLTTPPPTPRAGAPRQPRPPRTPSPASPVSVGSTITLESMTPANAKRTLEAVERSMAAGQHSSYLVQGLTPSRRRLLAAMAGRQGYSLRNAPGGVGVEIVRIER